jgi:hemimethylated DNA binding protein
LASLQGVWGDDVGLSIEISGWEARFSDEPDALFNIRETDGELELRGARLVSGAPSPLWKFPWGMVRRWAHKDPVGTGDSEWADLFHRYKTGRLEVRQQLQDAVTERDFSNISTLTAAWSGGFGFPLVAVPELRARLELGASFVPGVCIVHKRFGYRGIVIACEPWCTAPVAWRAQMDVASLPRGEAQPFYHCLVDERDRTGGQVTFVCEDNMEPSDAAFPVQNRMLDLLFIRCEGLGGYLPRPALAQALRQQKPGTFKL